MICSDVEESHSYQHLSNVLAIESMHGDAGSVMEIFGRLIPKSSEFLRNCVSPLADFVNNKPVAGLKNSEYRDTLKKVKSLPFSAYEETLIQVPEGFNGNLGKYLLSLISVHDKIVANANSFLLTYTDELAVFLNNVDSRKSVSVRDIATSYRNERTHAVKELASYFKAGSNLSRQKLGVVVTRFGELDDVFEAAEKLEVARSQANLSDLMNNVNHAVSLLDLIKTKLKEDENMAVSGAMAKHLSEGAYEVALFVEQVSMTCFAIDVALNVTQELAKQFNRITG